MGEITTVSPKVSVVGDNVNWNRKQEEVQVERENTNERDFVGVRGDIRQEEHFCMMAQPHEGL